MYLLIHTDQHVQILTNHGEEFLGKMNSKAIAEGLRALDLIPDDVDYNIKHATSKDAYNAVLLNHLKREATRKQVLAIFKVASEHSDAYGNMKEFAVRIVQRMQQGVYALQFAICNMQYVMPQYGGIYVHNSKSYAIVPANQIRIH